MYAKNSINPTNSRQNSDIKYPQKLIASIYTSKSIKNRYHEIISRYLQKPSKIYIIQFDISSIYPQKYLYILKYLITPEYISKSDGFFFSSLQ